MSLSPPLDLNTIIAAARRRAPSTLDTIRTTATRWLRGVRYHVDYELAAFFELPRERLETFAQEVDHRLYCPGVDRKTGLMHIGYIRMRPGNLARRSHPRGLPAFEELTWGVQLQPSLDARGHSTILPFTYSAAHLTGSHSIYRSHSREVDHYPVWECDNLQFKSLGTYGIAISEGSAASSSPICTMYFDESQLREAHFAPLPIAARVVRRDPITQRIFDNDFTFLGLVQQLDPGRVFPDFTFHNHPFFRGLFTETVTLAPASILVSRPFTSALQVLSEARPWQP